MKIHPTASAFATLLCFQSMATIAVRGEDAASTECSTLIESQGLSTNVTILEMWSKNAANLLPSTTVSRVLELAASANASKVDLYICSYKAYVKEGTVVKSVPVVTGGSVCASQTADCTTFAEYNNEACSQATACQTSVPILSFSADCSDISTDYPACELACAENDGGATGMETCVTSAFSPTEAPAPVPPVSAAEERIGAGLLLSGLSGILSVVSLALV